MDIRLIVHRTDTSLLLCYVDHHDAAYDWAKRRKIERHPKTGAAQLVEVRERVEEVIISQSIERTKPARPLLFAQVSDDDLLNYGVPSEWLKDVRQADEDSLFNIVDRLPQEAAEALLELATGGKPQKPTTLPVSTDPFNHPDAQRRFRVMTNLEELERALAFPWEKWAVFLHPTQRSLVERDYTGPARISGSAGTGKTIVALHRAVFLSRQHPKARILLSTFSDALANALHFKLERLVGNEPEVRNQIRVCSIQSIAAEFYTEAFGQPDIASPEQVRSLLRAASAKISRHRFSETFLWGEWRDVVDAWQLDTWETYKDVQRLGRKTRIGGTQREMLWSIFDQVCQQLEQRHQVTWSGLFRRAAEHLADSANPPFDFAVVDGNIEDRQHTVSVFNGLAPAIETYNDIEQEAEAVGKWILNRLELGLQPDEIGVFVRDKLQLERAIAAINLSGAKPVELDNRLIPAQGCVAVSTMHLAKGLEFRAVVVMACDDEILPLQERIESVSDESDLEDVYNTERHLLYVACTRARDYLLITGVDPASEFLNDLNRF